MDESYYDQLLPNGTHRRVHDDGRVETLKAPTRAEREHHAKQRREAIRRRHELRLVEREAQPDNVVKLPLPAPVRRWCRRTEKSPRPKPKRHGPPADVVPFLRRHAWRAVERHEVIHARDELQQRDGSWSPALDTLLGRRAGGHRHVRRATRLADGQHRLLDVGEVIIVGDDFFDGTRWRPCWSSVGHRVRHRRRHRRRLACQLNLRADVRPALASHVELHVELGIEVATPMEPAPTIRTPHTTDQEGDRT